MNRGDALLGAGKLDEAMLAYKAGVATAPNVKELPFWQAVTLADTGRIKEALPLFKEVFADDPNWSLLLTRLPAAGLLKNDPVLIAKILAVAPESH